MSSCEGLINACRNNDVQEVNRLISEGVNVKSTKDRKKLFNISQEAAQEGRTEIVKLLLRSNNIQLDLTSKKGNSLLYVACCNNRIELVKLILAHPDCSKDIVGIRNEHGFTAEIVATKQRYYTCAHLIKEYLHSVNEKKENRQEKTKLDILTLTEVAKKVEDLTAITTKLNDSCKKELKELENEYKRKRDDIREKYEIENKKFCSENENTKKALLKELLKRLGTGSSTHHTVSLIPTCPVCNETMKPPLYIFTCGNGHLICSTCKPSVDICSCKAKYMGRATAVEQMVAKMISTDN